MHFVKMHGLGNDFVLLDGRQTSYPLTPQKIQFLANRHRGIGFDQLILLEPMPGLINQYGLTFFNADGSSAEACGNGTRCAALYLAKEIRKNTITFQISGTNVEATIQGNDVTVNMGRPKTLRRFQSEDIPNLSGTYVNMGNPHVVFFTARLLTDAQIHSIGHYFPKGVNISCVQVIGSQSLQLDVFERGAGWTQACGTGACATFAAAVYEKKLDSPITIHQKGGDLKLEMVNSGDILMTGPATFVFKGELM